MKCEYNCGNDGRYQLKSGKWCCEKSVNSCPTIKQKSSDGLRLAYKEGRRDTSQFSGVRGWSNGKTAETDPRVRAKYTTPDSLLKDDTHFTASVKRAFGLVREYKCNKCGNSGEWQGEHLSLHIHHLDGNNRNNIKENLIYLCPNCHAQTENFGSKQRKIRNYQIISETNFVKALKESNNIREALISLNLFPMGANYDRANRLMKKYDIDKVKFIDDTANEVTRKRYPREPKYCECGKQIKYKSTMCSNCFNNSPHRRKVVDRPSKETLLWDVKELGYSGTARKYGVSDNSIRKWLK